MNMSDILKKLLDDSADSRKKLASITTSYVRARRLAYTIVMESRMTLPIMERWAITDEDIERMTKEIFERILEIWGLK